MKYLREPVKGERVRVYYNLHRSVWSVQNTKGQVIAHLPEVSLTNVSWVVRPAGRAKVIAEGKKNIHAFGVGNYTAIAGGFVDSHGGLTEPKVNSLKRARYNPYKAGHFIDEDGKKLTQSIFAEFTRDRVVYQVGGVG